MVRPVNVRFSNCVAKKYKKINARVSKSMRPMRLSVVVKKFTEVLEAYESRERHKVILAKCS